MYFEYDDIKGEIEVISYDSILKKAKVQYNDKIVDMSTSSILKCGIGGLIGKITSDFKFNIGSLIEDERHISRTNME